MMGEVDYQEAKQRPQQEDQELRYKPLKNRQSEKFLRCMNFTYEGCINDPFTEKEILAVQRQLIRRPLFIFFGGILCAFLAGMLRVLYIGEWSLSFIGMLSITVIFWLILEFITIYIGKFFPIGCKLYAEGSLILGENERKSVKFIDFKDSKEKTGIEFKSPEAKHMISVIDQTGRQFVHVEWEILKTKESEFKDRLYGMV